MSELRGLGPMLARVRRIVDRLPDDIGAALQLEAEQIMEKSKERYVPVDMGTLRDSGTVEPPEKFITHVQVQMHYGEGAAAPYAIAVHEHLSSTSPPTWQGKGTASSNQRTAPSPGVVTFHPAGRGPKYLEKPLLQAVKGMERRLGNMLRGSFAG